MDWSQQYTVIKLFEYHTNINIFYSSCAQVAKILEKKEIIYGATVFGDRF